MNTSYELDIGSKIKKARNENDITQQELAFDLNISVQHLSRIEHCKNFPSLDLLIRISKLLNVSTDYLLGLKSYEDDRFSNYLLELISNNSELDNNLMSSSDSIKEKKLKIMYQLINL